MRGPHVGRGTLELLDVDYVREITGVRVVLLRSR